ncbi:amidohydrolase family protein [Devosia sp. A8/3-2]|nr:amidohydrolase family protein [Devosia sp. A8/3-2]
MTRTILRGRVLSFVSEPQGIDDTASYRYFADGMVVIADGKVASVGDFDAGVVGDAEIIDHRPHLILPGFIDLHLHYVQSQMIASYAGSLLEWLNTYTFVEEQKFSQQGHAGAVASAFYDELIRNGTTTAVAYCSEPSAFGRCLFRRGRKAQYADGGRQGDDGSQCARSALRHGPIRL